MFLIFLYFPIIDRNIANYLRSNIENRRGAHARAGPFTMYTNHVEIVRIDRLFGINGNLLIESN